MAELVGLAVGHAGLESAAGDPDAEALAVVIAAALGGIAMIFGDRQAADLAAPVDDGRVEHAALLEILDQRRRRLVGAPTNGRQACCGCCCECPTADRRETAARTARPVRPVAGRSGSACRIRCVAGIVEPVHGVRGRGLARDIERLGRRGLHGGGQFITGDAGFQIGFARMLVEMPAIQLAARSARFCSCTSPRRYGGASRFRIRGSFGRSTVP